MPRLLTDTDRYAREPASVLVAAVHGSVRDLVRRRWGESGLPWAEFAGKAADTLITKADLAAIDRAVLETGHRYAFSAVISARERPDAYRGAEVAQSGPFGFAHPDAPTAAADAEGRALTGVGDNVVRRDANVRGRALYVRSSEEVIALMQGGVPDGSIAIIDDSGGTLTAPILESFAGVVCAGGTVRSHLGILTREYGIPCLMNVKLAGVFAGDLIELETSALARTADSYQRGEEMPARIWKVAQ
jgi:phosphohistidine swiveling domain-containing protein